MDFLLIILLTLLNGAFAMSELALTASRKVRLQTMAETGDKGAKAALASARHSATVAEASSHSMSVRGSIMEVSGRSSR